MATVGTAAAAARYAATSSAALGETGVTPVPGPEAVGFGQVLENALAATVRSVKEADAKATQAIAGAADITDVVTAVARAELALQTTVAIRDRVIQAYQEVMRMPI